MDCVLCKESLGSLSLSCFSCQFSGKYHPRCFIEMMSKSNCPICKAKINFAPVVKIILLKLIVLYLGYFWNKTAEVAFRGSFKEYIVLVFFTISFTGFTIPILYLIIAYKLTFTQAGHPSLKIENSLLNAKIVGGLLITILLELSLFEITSVLYYNLLISGVIGGIILKYSP